MGAATPPAPIKPPKAPDEMKARINALAYAELNRRIRSSSGRSGAFITGAKAKDPFTGNNQFKTLLGQ